MNTSTQQVDLTALKMPALPIQKLLQEKRLFDVTIDVQEMMPGSMFHAYASGESLRRMCEVFYPGSTDKGVFESPMFQVACDSAAYMIGMASEEFALQARTMNGKITRGQVWSRTKDAHAPFQPSWNVLTIALNDQATPSLVWGFFEDMRAIGLAILPRHPSECGRMN